MHQVNVHEAKTTLSKLLERVEAGEDVVIARNGQPVARLTAHVPAPPPRKGGFLKGKIWMADDWDEPDQELIDSFYTSKIFPDDPDLP